MNRYQTHQPHLKEYVLKTQMDNKPIIEFGSGDYSTNMLHEMCKESNRLLITIDDNEEWLSRYRHLENDNHKFYLVDKLHDDPLENWITFLDTQTDLLNNDYGIVFVDQDPQKARYETIKRYKNICDYLILHDCDAFPEKRPHLLPNHTFGKVIKHIVNGTTEGEYDFSDEFIYSKVFWPNKPWPGPTGPPTLVSSQKNEIK